MATVFTWAVDRMMTVQQPDPDYVVSVGWTLTGVDGEYTSSIQGMTPLTVSEDQTGFIPYDQLTPEIVIGWVQESLGESGVNSYENGVNGMIESQKNPPPAPTPTPLPWAPLGPEPINPEA